MPTTLSDKPGSRPIGDPDCPYCRGLGYVRRDVPVDHPDFGRLQICRCRQQATDSAARQRLVQVSNLEAFQSMTFETFKVKGRLGLADDQLASLQYALNQAQQYSQSLSGWLLLLGGYGCGKTHLAAAVANTAVNLDVPTLLLTVPDLLDWLRFAYDSTESTFEERFDEIRSIRLLVLDDLGTQNATPWAQEKLYQIINYRYINRLPTVITSNQEMEDIDGRIRSRLGDTDLVSRVYITAPDYRSSMADSTHPQLSSLYLHARRTFGSFSMREREKLTPEEQKSIQKAFTAAQKFAENPRGWLVLMGGYGTGKTHMAAAIGNYAHAQGMTPVFVVVPDLLDHLRATFNPNSSVSYDRLFEEVRSARLLILDDLGTQSATPWAREKLYQILNFRYNAELPTVITTSSNLDEMDPRIRTRMLDKHLCEIILFAFPSYRSGSGGLDPARTRRQKSTTK